METLDDHSISEHSLEIPTENDSLGSSLFLPQGATSLVIFALGSGGSRHLQRNRHTAMELAEAGFGALLLDLLTESEIEDDQWTHTWRLDVPLLAGRLLRAVRWAARNPETSDLRPAFFASGTGAAAALLAASTLGRALGAIVSRGGRPDLLTDPLLALVRAPTLFLVAEGDPLLAKNLGALPKLRCETRLSIIAHASHLLEEPGAVEKVTMEAMDWFTQHLAPDPER